MNRKKSQNLKRIVSGLLSLTMITSMSAVLPASAEEESTQGAGYNSLVGTADVLNSKGDVNGDGKVNTADKELLNKWLVRLVGENELDMENADVNMDGKVDIMDLVELSKLCKPESGSSDEDTFEQHIGEDSEIFSEINTEDNAFKVSLDITASDDVTASLSASESEYSSVIESDMVVGVVPEFECEEGISVNDVALNFRFEEESFTENTNGKYAAVSKDFEGIKRFNVFKYFDDIGMLLPVETTYDTENNKVTTHVDELGTYCLVDMEQWFENLGITPEEYKKTLTQKTNENNTTAIKTSAKAGDTIVETDFIPESNEQVFRYAEAKGLYKDGDNYELDHNKQKNKTLDIAIDMSVGIGNDEKIRELVKLEAKSFLYFVYNFHFDESCNIRVLFYNYDMNKSWTSGCWQPDNYKFYREAYNYEDCVKIIDNINVREGYIGKYPETIDEHNSFRPDIRYLEKTIPFSRDNTIWFEPDSFYVFNKDGYITYMDYEGILFRFRNNIAIYTLIESGKASPYFKFRDYRINKNIKTMAVSFLPYMSCFCSPISEDERYDDAMKSSSLYSFDDYMYFGYERSLQLSRYIAGLPELNNNNDNNNDSGSGNNSGSGSGNNSGSGSGNNKDYLTILPTNWKAITLDAPITKDYKDIADKIEGYKAGYLSEKVNTEGYADTDKDGLLDLEEIAYEYTPTDADKSVFEISWDENGDVVLPSLGEIMDIERELKIDEETGANWIPSSLKSLPIDKLNNIKILPVKSDPTEKDSDYDYINDSDEKEGQVFIVNAIEIDDTLLDDSGSIDGNNPVIKDTDLAKMYMNVSSCSTAPVSFDDENSPKKNELIFTRTRKYGKTDAKFSITPSRNSDFAFTITGTTETKPEGEYTTEDFNSTVKVSYNKGKNKVKPVEINLSDPVYYGDGTEIYTTIEYVFAFKEDTEYTIYVNNPTNDHKGEYDIHVSEDNWVYAPNGGIITLESAYIGEIPFDTAPPEDQSTVIYIDQYYNDYKKIYMSNSYLEKWLTQAKSYPVSDELTTDAFQTHLQDSISLQFFDKNHVLHISSNEAVEMWNELATVCTYGGAALLLLGTEAPFALGAVFSGGGAIATFIPFCISDDNYENFEKSLGQAINDFQTKNISLSLEIYEKETSFVRENVAEWSSWDNNLYISKYEFGYHGTVVTFTDSPVFYDDLIQKNI